MLRALVLVALLSNLAPAQTTRLVRGVGQATLTAKPDQAKLSVGVVTQSSTAQDAASKNAAVTSHVIAELQRTLGAGADIQTVGYSLTPNYQYPPNAAPVLTGYTATNTLQVTIDDLSLTGAVIDAANLAGANSIGGLTFTLKDSEPLRQRALTAAAKQSRAHAEAIAAGLSARLGAVLVAQEGSNVSPVYNTVTGLAPAAPTPILTGLVSVSATVTADFELAP